MNLKLLLMKKGLTQIELSRKIGANYAQVNLQIRKHRMLPKKYLDKFCEILEISKDDLEKSMLEEANNE